MDLIDLVHCEVDVFHAVLDEFDSALGLLDELVNERNIESLHQVLFGDLHHHHPRRCNHTVLIFIAWRHEDCVFAHPLVRAFDSKSERLSGLACKEPLTLVPSRFRLDPDLVIWPYIDLLRTDT